MPVLGSSLFSPDVVILFGIGVQVDGFYGFWRGPDIFGILHMFLVVGGGCHVNCDRVAAVGWA